MDEKGNLFISDDGNSLVAAALVEVPVSCLLPKPACRNTVIGSGLSFPVQVAVDGTGDVFVADPPNNQVLEVTVNCLPPNASCDMPVGSGLNNPYGVAVNGAGDVFIAENASNLVLEVPAGCTSSSCQTTVASGLEHPNGVAVDGAGDVFIADTDNNRVVEVQTVSVNFSNVNVGASSTLTLTYNVNQSVTLGSNPSVVTQGAANLDFTLASGNTCTGALSAGSQCTVNVTFGPKAPGLREGAVQITDSSGNILATTLVRGIGEGPAIAFGPGAQIAVGSGLTASAGVAVDAAGDVFIASEGNNDVVEVPAGCTSSSCQVTVGSGLNSPAGVAVDGAGDVFIADRGNNRVVEVPAHGGAQTAVGSGLLSPFAVSVDGAGDVFVADGGNNRVVEVPAAGGAQTTLGSGLSNPQGVAVDGAGDVFISDYGNNRVVEVPAGCTNSSCQTTLTSGLNEPDGVAVDGAGDVFIADSFNARVLEVPAGCTSSSCQTTVGSGLGLPVGVAVDGAGDVFIADSFYTNLLEEQRSQPPALSFAATAVGSTSSDSPQSVTVQNIGNLSLNAVAPGLSITGTNSSSFKQVAGSGTSPDCTATFSLVAGASCNVSVSFTPAVGGSNTAAATLTDNALNAAAATQNISLSGTGLAPVAGVSPSNLNFGNQPQGTTSAAQTVTLSNTGTAALAISSISISGNFAETNNCGTSLAQNASCQISVTFTPQSTGALTGMLTINDNNNGVANSMQTVTLNGTGTNFTISASPASQTIPSGHKAIYTLTLGSVAGFTGTVSLGCSGGPPNSTCTISPGSVSLPGATTATITLLAPRNVDHGTFTLTFTGIFGSGNPATGGLTQSTTASLTVK